jgi:hypothetical protein
MAVFEFGDVLLVFEVRGLVGKDKPFPPRVENEFYTTEGRIAKGRFYSNKGGDPVPLDKYDVQVTPGGPIGSFLQAVRSRKVEDLNASAEVGHYSAALCHLGNISYRLGQPVPFSGKTKTLGDNRQVVETFNNLQANLKGAEVKLEETAYQLGRVLTFDPATERFTGEGAAAANPLLTRPYRKPFVVPDKA